jgi:hypothetical protein
MAFLFKSKKHGDKAGAGHAKDKDSKDSSKEPAGRVSKDSQGNSLAQTPTPTGSASNSISSFGGNGPMNSGVGRQTPDLGPMSGGMNGVNGRMRSASAAAQNDGVSDLPVSL